MIAAISVAKTHQSHANPSEIGIGGLMSRMSVAADIDDVWLVVIMNQQ
jgi:hypothetical protein